MITIIVIITIMHNITKRRNIIIADKNKNILECKVRQNIKQNYLLFPFCSTYKVQGDENIKQKI